MSTKAKQVGVEVRAQAVKLGVWPCCLNCEYWIEHSEIHCGDPSKNKREMRCSRYNMQPPPDVIVVGCNQHIPYIPF